MSRETEEQIRVLASRGVPEGDPRIQGLRRRLAKEEEEVAKAQRVTERMRNAVRRARRNEDAEI